VATAKEFTSSRVDCLLSAELHEALVLFAALHEAFVFSDDVVTGMSAGNADILVLIGGLVSVPCVREAFRAVCCTLRCVFLTAPTVRR
jgi:hypothetical protein